MSPKSNNSEKGIFDHIDDLTRLLLRVGIFFAISTAVCFIFTPKLFQIILNELLEKYDVTIGTIRPIEILMTQIKMAAFGGLILSSPVNIPLIWSYIRPALEKNERKAITVALIPSITLFIIGFAFAYGVILPLAINFLINLAISFNVTPFWTISSYVSLVLSLGIAFGIAFELPVVILVLGRLGIVTYDGLKRSRKYVIVTLLIVSALITPPDVVSQVLLALPLLLLYEGSILLVRIFKSGDTF